MRPNACLMHPNAHKNAHPTFARCARTFTRMRPTVRMMHPSDRKTQPPRSRECALEYGRARPRKLTFTEEGAGLAYPQEKRQTFGTEAGVQQVRTRAPRACQASHRVSNQTHLVPMRYMCKRAKFTGPRNSSDQYFQHENGYRKSNHVCS